MKAVTSVHMDLLKHGLALTGKWIDSASGRQS